jgi:hypothetical protein
MPVTGRPEGVEDQPAIDMVAAILESWSVDEVRQLVEEIEAEITRRQLH